MTAYRYEVDADDRIVSVSPEWALFARANGALPVVVEGAIGQVLWLFIEGVETRHLYQQLFAKVRTDGLSRSVLFRCDGSDCRRYMRLTVASALGGGLVLTSELLREEPRDMVPLLAPSGDRSDELLVMCSWCKKVRTSVDVWVEVEDAIDRLGLFTEAPLPRITHGMCRPCYDGVEVAIG